MNRCLYLIDPSISNGVGHYAEYARAICNAARASGNDVRVLAHHTVSPDVSRDLSAEPVFRYDFWHRFIRIRKLGFLLDPMVTNWVFYRDLNRALNPNGSDERVLFMPTLDHHQMLAWAWWLSHVAPQRAPRVVLLFRYTYCDVRRNPPWIRDTWWARLGFRALERAARGRYLRLATDSARLAEEYRQLTQMPMEVFPIPHTADLAWNTQSPTPAQPQSLQFVSLGDARTEKGFVLIADAIRCLQTQNQLDGLEFVIQCNINSKVYAALRKTRQALADLRLPNVQLVDQVLSREAYNRLLCGADVVLLPYSRRVYYARTSGPCAEALAAGKPVIVTQDTWMSDQLAEYGAGVTFCDGDAGGLALAILEVRDCYPALAEQAHLRRQQWVSFHNPETFVRLLLEM